MKKLILYAGLGGESNLWDDECTHVEIDPKIAKVLKDRKPNREVIIGDAHQYLLDNYNDFDFIWSSPPCQSHSRMAKATRHKSYKYPDMILYQEIIFLDNFFKGPWVVENVVPYYKPLIAPSIKMGRHLIWSNFNITPFDIKRPTGFINKTNVEGSEELKKWLGINYKGNLYYDGNHCPAQVLRNCVHPELGLHILNSYV